MAAAPWKGAAALTYEKDVLPILKKHCNECHNAEKIKGGVSIEVADMKADVGRIVIPGKPGDSMLFEVLFRTDIKNKMPPRGGPLPEKDLIKIRDWIRGGARFRGDRPGRSGFPTPAARRPLPGRWTNKAGKSIQADLLRVEGGKAILRLPNGRIYKYPIPDLSEESAAKARAYSSGE